MTDDRSWEGNWKARLYERVRERGYDSLTAFAEARPTASFVSLAEELGPDDVAGAQVYDGLVAEAVRSKQVTRLVRGHLVRELWGCLPEGWPVAMDDESRFRVAKAIGLWSGIVPVSHKERVRRAREVLRANPPPAGWRPLGPDDELLRTLLPDDEA
ncbi:NUDIX hydrolase [Myxococcus faecalis]|uniref:NUDIX hydrolase n=1 Tax=Myxococcus faecalis TaxID=3115646 RepID=UPI003CEE15DE